MKKRLQKKMHKKMREKEQKEAQMRRRLTLDMERSLLFFSKGEMQPEEARGIATKVMSGIDIHNPVFGHKGPSWLAREVLINRKKSGN